MTSRTQRSKAEDCQRRRRACLCPAACRPAAGQGRVLFTPPQALLGPSTCSATTLRHALEAGGQGWDPRQHRQTAAATAARACAGQRRGRPGACGCCRPLRRLPEPPAGSSGGLVCSHAGHKHASSGGGHPFAPCSCREGGAKPYPHRHTQAVSRPYRFLCACSEGMQGAVRGRELPVAAPAPRQVKVSRCRPLGAAPPGPAAPQPLRAPTARHAKARGRCSLGRRKLPAAARGCRRTKQTGGHRCRGSCFPRLGRLPELPLCVF